jgi:cold shock CspA family protein
MTAPVRVQGVVIRLYPNKGFGFVRGQDHLSRFFHYSDAVPTSSFDTMREGQAVSFEPIETAKGPRAIQVKAES